VKEAMFNRAILWAIVWSCAATTCVSANAISDWNEKTVDRNLARALARVATQLSKIGDHIVDLELKFAQLRTINGNLHEQ
jgi:hypothetical protein